MYCYTVFIFLSGTIAVQTRATPAHKRVITTVGRNDDEKDRVCVTEHLSLSVENQFSTKRATSSSRVSYHSISDHIYKLIFHAASRIKTVFSYLVNNYYPVRVFRIQSSARQFQSGKSGVIFAKKQYVLEKLTVVLCIMGTTKNSVIVRATWPGGGSKRRIVLKN